LPYNIFILSDKGNKTCVGDKLCCIPPVKLYPSEECFAGRTTFAVSVIYKALQ